MVKLNVKDLGNNDVNKVLKRKEMTEKIKLNFKTYFIMILDILDLTIIKHTSFF